MPTFPGVWSLGLFSPTFFSTSLNKKKKGADCSRVARATTPGPPPQPHGWVRLGFEVSRFPDFCEGGWHVLTYLGVWSLGLFSPTFFSTSSKKKRANCLPAREASLIKKEYCRCGPHPLQVTSSRARPPLVKGAGCIGPLFPEFRGWPLWFMASIALRGL